MAVARVVSFEGVTAERVAEMQQEIEVGGRPEGVPASEIIVLHDREAERAVVVVFFDGDEEYRQGDETLNAMDPSETPGRRTDVTRYDVVARMSG